MTYSNHRQPTRREHESRASIVKSARRANEFFYRQLFLALIMRDIAVRYKQTAIGVAWVVIQPLTMVAIFSFLLGKIGIVPTGALPYPLFAFAAMVFWQVFSRALVEGSMRAWRWPAQQTRMSGALTKQVALR